MDAVRPSGTVTFAFTDIEGSTERWERDRWAMQAALRLHDDLMRAAILAHGGYIFKTIGDAFCAAFPAAPSAVAAMIDAQRALATADFSAVDGIRVRAAVHTGTADERDGDYFGPTINRVARLLAVGHGGQILVSSATAALVPPGEVELRDLGMHRLKDLHEPEHVRDVLLAGRANDFPPLRSLNAANNLPLQLTELVGRERELDELHGLCAGERLVTILGAGGVGKTRLALHVAAQSLDGTGDGVWFVELAGLRDETLVALEIASCLSLPVSSSVSALDVVLRHLRARRLLLVLDNCEHVVHETARIVARIVGACPEVRVLATSREALNIAGEYAYRLHPLLVPARSSQISAAEAAQSAAVRLFVQRARSASRAFTLTDDNAADVCDIVRRLDGIALAIELAATRISVLSVRALSARLDERLRLLTGGSRTAIPHQRTMRALIDWSYDLLSAEERMVLRRVSVFAGGWTLEAAEMVCASGEIADTDVLDLLSQLADKSLIVVEFAEASTRYRLLETMREYAREKASETAELDEALGRHAQWVRAFARRMHGSYDSSPAWFTEIEAEVDNARAALDWSLTRGHDPVVAAGIVSFGFSGWWYYKSRNEGLRWSRAALRALDDARDPLAKAEVGRVAGCFGNGEEAIAMFADALAIREAHPDFTNIERSFLLSGIAALQFDLRRFDEASDAIDRALVMREAEGPNPRVLAMMLDTRAKILMARGRFEAARAVLGDAQRHFASAGEMPGMADIFTRLANIDFAEDQPAAALELLDRAVEIYRERRVSNQGAESLADAAICRLRLGHFGSGERDARESIALRSSENEPASPGALLVLATLAERAGNVRAAARVLGYVDAHDSESLTPERLIQLAARDALRSALLHACDGVTLDALLAEGACAHERSVIAGTAHTEHVRIA